MTNNPTIDGVSRELVETLHHMGFTHSFLTPAITAQLRALLDREVITDDHLRQRIAFLTSEVHAKSDASAALQSTIARLEARIAELESGRGDPFQYRVQPWMMDCFGPAISSDREERNHRFLEEALELVQACGASSSEAHQMVDYVYGRPVGEPAQEVGGVMVTLAALCLANGLDMHADGETELARIWTKVEQIRAKQAAKPAMSPLPGVYSDRAPPAPVAVVLPERCAGAAFGRLDEYRQGWNACLDATAALNGPAEPLPCSSKS